MDSFIIIGFICVCIVGLFQKGGPLDRLFDDSTK